MRPVPEAPATFSPELIVELKLGEKPASGEYVYLKSPLNIPAYFSGIKADKDGKAWFIAPEEGDYEIVFFKGKDKYTEPISLKRISNLGKPGYKDFNWFKWEVK